MRRAHQPNPDPPAPRSRSDSFVRMLELEKMCKMNRILRDHGSSTSTSNTSRASFPSVTTNPPASRSRRASDYPPLSHQTQIMKAVRRSAALPSLSLSIPPSPAPATMKSEGSVEELSLAKEERSKTVTFSEPEDEEVSDDSSICQSPSWEQYSQKKKQRKKGANQKNTKEKEETASKKRSNRLTKSAPTHPFTIGSLTASDRSISAPDLGTSIRTSKMNPSSLMTRAQVALDKHQTLGNEPSLMTKDKRKSKGFLSGFKIQHGNVAAVQKLIEARKGAEKGPERGTDEDEPLRSIQYETIPVTQPITARHGIDQNMSRPRKPPSIRSVISTSDHSLSSQEKRSSGARASTGLGHGRSQSLLSSTLNKLRGPSYLYYQPSGDDSSGDPPKHSDSLKEVDVAHGKPIDVFNDQAGERPEERGSANSEHPQLSFDFAFSPRIQRMNTEPGPEIAPRGRQPRLRKVEIQSPDLEQDVAVLRPYGGRRVQIEVPQVSTRDTVMAMVEAQEKQSQAAYASQQTRSNLVSGNLTQDHLKSHQRGADFDGKLTMPQHQGGEIDRFRSAHAVNMPNTERLHEKERKLAAESNQNDRVDISNGHVPEDDEISVDTYASTIRPTSHQNIPLPDDIESRAHATVTEGLEVRTQTVAEKPVVDLITFERDVPDTLQQPLQPHREVDYFASFSDSYLPPVLNLRSLRDGKFSSPILPSPEESDEDSELHGHFLNDHTKKRAVENGRVQMDSHRNGSHPQESGRASNEQKPKNSPATSTQYSDSDVPAFERLGLSSKAAKVLVGAEMASTSTAHSQQTNPSRTTSERSSSSICDDSPPSPSSVTTPDSSRPQSRKGGAVSQSESSQTTLLESMPQVESVPSHQNSRSLFDERFEETALGRTNVEVDGANVSDWSKAAITLNSKQQRLPTPTKAGSLATSPSLAATPTTSVSFANVLRQDLDEEGERDVGHHPAPPVPPRAQSALDLRLPTNFMPQSSRPQRLHLKQNAVTSSVSLPSSPPADLTEGVMPRKSALKMSRNNSTSGPELSTTMSVGAAYLQEARKAAPVSTVPSPRGLRPHFSQKNSSGSIRSVVSAGNRAEPLAKMLVECCNCHFFHDMPSRVYECMAKPDSVVEDKLLGVSAAITTMVRCPWCAHGMTTQCCSGYAAVVYLKEKLHGK